MSGSHSPEYCAMLSSQTDDEGHWADCSSSRTFAVQLTLFSSSPILIRLLYATHYYLHYLAFDRSALVSIPVSLFYLNCDTSRSSSSSLTTRFYLIMPPSTRGASRASRALVSTAPSAIMPHANPPKPSRKRKAKDAAPETPTKRTKMDVDSSGDPPSPSLPPLENASLDASDAPKIFPATLTFSYMDAKEHLVRADPRFAGLFSRLGCKPFEHLERVEPFRFVISKRKKSFSVLIIGFS